MSLVQAELSVARDDRQYLIKRLLRHEGYESLEREICCQEEDSVSAIGTNQDFPSTKKRLNQPKKSESRNLPPPLVIKGEPGEKLNSSLNRDIKLEMVQSVSGGGSVAASISGIPGKLKTPLNLFNILLHSIGQIVTINPNFHSEHWIYPMGYVATRIYAHPRDPQRKCVFTCKILNNGGSPQFQIIPDNDLDAVIFGDSPFICHLALLQAIQAALTDKVKLPMHVQGERFFGLANPTIQSMIRAEGCNLERCTNFRGFLTQQEMAFAHQSEEKDPTISFEALQSLINMSTYHTIPEIKDEPPDELFELN